MRHAGSRHSIAATQERGSLMADTEGLPSQAQDVKDQQSRRRESLSSQRSLAKPLWVHHGRGLQAQLALHLTQLQLRVCCVHSLPAPCVESAFWQLLDLQVGTA